MMPLKVQDPKPLLLFFPFELLSHYLRCLMLAKYFSPYFEIQFLYSKSYVRFVKEEGYDSFTCISLDAEKVMESVKKFDFSWINQQDLEVVFNAQVKTIQQLKPTVVVGDTSPSLKMAAEKMGVHFISLVNGYMSRFYMYSRKLSRTHPAYPLLQMIPENIVDALTKKGEAISMKKVHFPFRRIRRKYNLSEKKSYLEELEGDINLVCDLEEIFPQKSLPANYRIISPLYYDAPTQSTGLVQKLDKAKKTIFVSMGSTGDWSKTIFLNDPYFRKYNLVTAGDNENVLNGPHIIKVAFINFHELFPMTDLVVCHGGNGTIYQALFYGIPLLCKTSHFEQEWNVAAIERLAAGKSLDDVSDIQTYISLVDEWIDKKGKNLLTIYRERIIQEKQQLAGTIAELVTNISAIVG